MRKKLLTILGGTALFLGAGVTAPVIPTETVWLETQTVLRYDTSDGLLKVGEYGLDETGEYYWAYVPEEKTATSTIPASEIKFKIGDRDVSKLKYVELLGEVAIRTFLDGDKQIKVEATKEEYDLKEKAGEKPTYTVLKSVLAARKTEAASASILDTYVERAPGSSTGDSFAYSVSSTGENRCLLYVFGSPSGGPPSAATYNGTSLTRRTFTVSQYHVSWGYLANPATGSNTYSTSYPSQIRPSYRVFTLQDCDQSTVFTADANSGGNPGSPSRSVAANATDLVYGFSIYGNSGGTATQGSGQTEGWATTEPYAGNEKWVSGYKEQTADPETISFTISGTAWEIVAFSIKYAAPSAPAATPVVPKPQTIIFD